MTRINLGIPVENLTDQHLLAEYRELPRIPRKVKDCLKNDKLVNITNGDFKLGSGHVRWFYDKLSYLEERYFKLHAECTFRGFEVSLDKILFEPTIKGFSKYLGYVEQIPQSHIELIKARIAERITDSKQIPRLFKKPIDKNTYISQILQF